MSDPDKCRNVATRRGRDDWSYCCVCDGRIHEDDCKSRRQPAKDCCEARHRRLFEQGKTVGLSDSSQPMYDPSRRTWA